MKVAASHATLASQNYNFATVPDQERLLPHRNASNNSASKLHQHCCIVASARARRFQTHSRQHFHHRRVENEQICRSTHIMALSQRSYHHLLLVVLLLRTACRYSAKLQCDQRLRC
jgi:hypothetical protein